jgi:hypothetical protein
MYVRKKIVLIGLIMTLLLLPNVYAEDTFINFWDEYNDIPKDTFFVYSTIYIKGNGFSSSTNYSLYLVYDVTLVNGMIIPSAVPDTLTSVLTDEEGGIPLTEVWNQLYTTVSDYLPLGEYHIIIDVNGDGVFDDENDFVDTMNIVYPLQGASFPEEEVPRFSTPEFPGGTLLAIAAFVIAFFIYQTRSSPKAYATPLFK